MSDETKVEKPAEPALVSKPEVQPVPVPAQTPAPSPAEIKVTPEEYKLLLESRTKLAEIQAENARIAEEREQARLKSMAEKGEIERALGEARDNERKRAEEYRQRAESLEGQILNGYKDRVINDALLSVKWADEYSGPDARQLLENRFEATRDAVGNVVVREKGTMRPAADVIKEWIASPRAARYIAASSQGGAGSQGTEMGQVSTGGNPQPKPISEQVVDYLRNQRSAELPKYGFGRPLSRSN